MSYLSKQHSNGNKVVSFKKFQMKKTEEEYLARGRQPLYVSHARSLIRKDNEEAGQKNLSNFGDRIAQMRHKIKKIDAFVGHLSRIASLQSRGK